MPTTTSGRSILPIPMNKRIHLAKPSRRSVLLLTASIASLTAPVLMADSSKANNNMALNLPASWANGIVPDLNNLAIWDSTFTAVATQGNGAAAAGQPSLGADIEWKGIQITNVGGTRDQASFGVAIQDVGSTKTLRIGSGGIDMSAALQALLIQSRVALTASQTWTVVNANNNTGTGTTGSAGLNNNEDLTFAAQGNGATFDLGNNTVTTAGVGTINIQSSYTVQNGTFNVGNTLFIMSGGFNRVLNLANTLTANVASGATLQLQSNSGVGGLSLTSAANYNLNGGTLKLVSNNATNLLSITGGTVTVNSASTLNIGNNVQNGSVASNITFNAALAGSGNLALTNNASTAVVLLMGGNNGAYTGTITFGGTAGRISRLTTANSGSANATWSVGTGLVLQVDGVGVQLGTLNGAGTVTNSHAANPATISVGAGTFTGTITNGTGTGGLGLTKVGSGTLTLNGANTFSGPTNVNGGTLALSPGSIGNSAVTVASGATLAVNAGIGGALGAASVAVADGGTLRLTETTTSTQVSMPSLTLGTGTGATLSFDLGAFSNPGFSPLSVTNGAVTGATGPLSFAPGGIVKVVGTGLTVGSGIPLISYVTLSGAPVSSLTLSLPPRTVGNLVNNSGFSEIELNITALEQVKWRGNVNTTWDLDPDGSGTQGTANWVTTVSATSTKYLQGTGGTDTVNFDDSATNTNVSLSTNLSPVGTNVDNTTKNYVFTGPGKLTGIGGLTKNGDGKLTLVNTVAYDYTGATTINGGTLEVGDGTTANAGQLPAGSVVINAGTLALNRAENFTMTSVLSGTGTLEKRGTNTATLSAVSNFTGGINVKGGTLSFNNNGFVASPVTIDAGATLKYSGTSTITSTVSGAGTFEVTGGSVQLAGFDPNTMATTNVSNGVLQLNKSPGVNAVAGNITLTGNGAIQLIGNDQIPDTATIFQLGTNTEGMVGASTGTETVANVVVNGSVATAQLIMRNNFTVSDTATVQNGIFAAASGHTANVNKIVLSTGGTLRVAASSAATTLNVGAGGITASGGTIEIKFNTNNIDGILNLNGDFTATGNVAINNGGYTGANLNVIRLNDTRTFNIAAGTTTTVAADFDGNGNLVKTGGGTLLLNTTSGMNALGTVSVNAGSLVVLGSVTGTTGVTVNSGGTLAGTGTISPSFASNITVANGGILSPGNGGVGTLTTTLSVGLLDVEPAAAGTGSLKFDLAAPGASDKVMVIGGFLHIGTQALEFNDFSFTALAGFDNTATYTLFDSDVPIDGTLGNSLTGLVGGQLYQLGFGDGTNDLVIAPVLVPEPGTAACLLGGLAICTLLPRNRNRKALSCSQNAG